MHIIQEIRGVIGWVIRQVLYFLGFVIAAALAPIILAVLPQVLILSNPREDFTWLAHTFIWLTPLSVAFWMVVLCHWHSVRAAQRENKLSTWRKDHGGIAHTLSKSMGFMLLGLFGSFVCEISYVLLWNQIVPDSFDGASAFMVWFAVFPFAAFAPVLVLLYKRRNYTEAMYENIEGQFKRDFTMAAEMGNDYNPFDDPDAYADDDPNISLACWSAKRKRAAALAAASTAFVN